MIKWISDWKRQRKLRKDGWLVVMSWTELSHCDEEIYQQFCKPRLCWLVDNEIENVIFGSGMYKLWLCPEDAMGFKLVWGCDEQIGAI